MIKLFHLQVGPLAGFLPAATAPPRVNGFEKLREQRHRASVLS
jgi:hypothetical protein